MSIGGAMVDTIAIIESDRIERMSMLNAETSFLLLEEGRKTEALDVSTHCGGGAVNTAVALARLGFDVSALVKLGRDARAEFLLARLGDEGVSTRWVIRDAAAPTGASVIVSSHDRNAAVFTFRGANTLLSPADLTDAAFAADLVYVSSLSNRSADCFPTIIDKAKVARGLVGGGYEMSLPAFLHAVRGLGTKYVMLTDGHGGAFVCANESVLFCPAVDATVASTTGAGDAMAATFAAYIALGRPGDVALRAATINAASVVAYIDTQSGLLRRDALEGRLAARSDLHVRKWKL